MKQADYATALRMVSTLKKEVERLEWEIEKKLEDLDDLGYTETEAKKAVTRLQKELKNDAKEFNGLYKEFTDNYSNHLEDDREDENDVG